MKALLLDDTHPLLEEGLIAGGLELVRTFEEPLAELTERHADAEVIIIRSRLKVTKDFLNAFPQLKVIGRLGAGLENIDVEEAARKQIVCLRVPEGECARSCGACFRNALEFTQSLATCSARDQSGKMVT